jgi:hypothetical protein
MYTNQQASKYGYQGRGFMFWLLVVIFCFCNGQQVRGMGQTASSIDTIPGNELQNIQWDKVTSFVPENGVFIVKLDDGQSMIVKRKDYEDYARKKQEPNATYGTFTKVEIEPEYPGGEAAWNAYVNKNLQYPAGQNTKNMEGTVIVMFLVEPDGSVNQVKAIAGPTNPRIREEAERLVKMSGLWNTAIQNFRIVRAYKKQSITFTR